MAFLEFECFQNGGKRLIRPTGESFSLAGCSENGLIYQAWQQQGEHLDTGWHVSRDELIRIHSDGNHDHTTRRLIIDFHPSARWRISLGELLDIYAYTWGDGNGGPAWTPLMLRLRDIFYKEYDPQDCPYAQQRDREKIQVGLPEPKADTADFVEFLYLTGNASNGCRWNWGKNGMTNAAFLHGAARDYFRQFF